MFQPGDVVLVPFLFSNLHAAKRRLVLILTPPDALGDVVCLAITSSAHHEAAFQLDEASFLEGVLPKISWVRVSKVYTPRESVISGTFGRLHPEVMDSYCSHLGCQ
ncbi:type II toxin-antitoxin system PemK/MazF family toxin [Sulfurivermis fontis]|uniref:type II toxin-antitoxin system PemK/MazF family toxin n=1 Tax=Sulfurivermis fontis TaxID=1972068 RepID=UPI000FDB50D9